MQCNWSATEISNGPCGLPCFQCNSGPPSAKKDVLFLVQKLTDEKSSIGLYKQSSATPERQILFALTSERAFCRRLPFQPFHDAAWSNRKDHFPGGCDKWQWYNVRLVSVDWPRCGRQQQIDQDGWKSYMGLNSPSSLTYLLMATLLGCLCWWRFRCYNRP